MHRLGGQPPGHLTQHGIIPHRHHQGRGTSADDIGAQKTQDRIVCRPTKSLGASPSPGRLPSLLSVCFFPAAVLVGIGRQLLHRLTLPRQGRLADEKIFGREDSHIRRNHIPGRQVDNIPHHQLVQGNLLFSPPLPLHAGGGLNHIIQPGSRIAGTGLLDKAQNSGEKHQDGNNDHRGRILCPRVSKYNIRKCTHQSQNQQHQGKGIDKGLSQLLPEGLLPPVGNDILSVNILKFLCLVLGQSPRVGSQILKNRLRCKILLIQHFEKFSFHGLLPRFPVSDAS